MRPKRNWRDRSPFRSIRASVKRGTVNEGPKPEKPAPPPGVAPLVFDKDHPLGFLDEHMPKIEPAPKKRKAHKPKEIPEIVHTIEGLPIKLGIDALKAELDAVTSIRSEDFGWVLSQGDDILAVISHGKLTNRALVQSINNRTKPRAS